MSNIKTTSDGYSFHTPALTVHIDRASFNEALDRLYNASKKSRKTQGTTYPLKRYQSEHIKPHCSTMLSHHGIMLYLTDRIKDGWHKYTIKAVVNPRKVLDPECSYLGIAPTDSNSLDQFQDEFTMLMRKYRLPEFLDEWKLTRLDLCVNLQLNKKRSAREFCRLLQKDLLLPKLEQVFFYDPDDSKEVRKTLKDIDAHSICLKNDSYSIVVYDKLFQLESEGLMASDSWHALPDGILRLELRCFRTCLKKLAKQEGLNSTSEQLYWMAQHSRELILKKVMQAFSGGTHYKPDIAKQIISGANYHETTCEQLQWLINRTRYSFNLQQLEKGMEKNFDVKP